MPRKNKKDYTIQKVLYYKNIKENKLEYVLFDKDFYSCYDEDREFALKIIEKQKKDFLYKDFDYFFTDSVFLTLEENDADELAKSNLEDHKCKVCKENFIFKADVQCKCMEPYGYCPNCGVRYEELQYENYTQMNKIQ
jgi:hypothetical protein